MRAVVHRPEQATVVQATGATEAVEADLRDEAVVSTAMQDVSTVYHICPNVHPDEVAIAQRVIEAARRVGASRIVYHSVLHPQLEAMPHHVASGCLSLRSQPSREATILSCVPNGHIYLVTNGPFDPGTREDWFEVYSPSIGEGWVIADYLYRR